MRFTFLPFSYKVNLIQTSVHRAFQISSNYINFDKEVIFITKYFCNNGFPISIVECLIGETVTKLVAREQIPGNEHSSKLVVGLFQFHGKHSHAFSHKLQALVSKHFEGVKIRLVFTAARALGFHSPFKDKTPMALQSGIIYLYSWGRCNGSYIGQTSTHFQICMAEHCGLNFRTGTVDNAPLHSVRRDHSLEADHPISL